MKKEEIIKNLTEVYNVLMDELSEEQISKFGYSEEIKPEDFCQFIFSRADSIAYEELDKDYVGGLEHIILPDVGVRSDIVIELLAHGIALLESYGLTEEEYKEWQAKHKNTYSPILNAITGDISEASIREMIVRVNDDACAKKMKKELDMSFRNGVCITSIEEETKNGKTYKLFSQQLTFSEELIRYNRIMSSLDEISWENWNVFLEEYKGLASGSQAFSKNFNNTMCSFCESYLKLLNNNSKTIVRMLRTSNVDSKNIGDFTETFKKASKNAKENFYKLIESLSDAFYKNVPEEKGYSNVYLNQAVYYNHLSRVLDLPLATESTGAAAMHVANQAATDMISGLANTFADAVKNAMELSAFESRFKEEFYGDELYEAVGAIYDDFTNKLFKSCLRTLGINDYDVFYESVPEDCRELIQKSIGEEKGVISSEDCKKINKSYVLSYPLDEEHYVDLYVWYGDAVGQIKEIAEEIFGLDLQSELEDVQDELIAEYRSYKIDTAENANKLLVKVCKQVSTHVLYNKIKDYKEYLQKVYAVKMLENTGNPEAIKIHQEFLQAVINRLGKRYMPGQSLAEQRELLPLIDETKFGEIRFIFGDIVFTSTQIVHMKYRLVDCCFNLGDIQRILVDKSMWSNYDCKYFTLYLGDSSELSYEMTIQTSYADAMQQLLLTYALKYREAVDARSVEEILVSNTENTSAFEENKPEEAKLIEELEKLHGVGVKSHAVEHNLIDENWKINEEMVEKYPYYYYMVVIIYAYAEYNGMKSPKNVLSRKKDAPPFEELESYFKNYEELLLQCGLLCYKNDNYSWKNMVDRRKASYYIDEQLIKRLTENYKWIKDRYERIKDVYEYRKAKEEKNRKKTNTLDKKDIQKPIAMVTVSPANKTVKVAAEAKKQNEEVKKQISDTNKDVPAFSNVEKSEIVRSETEKVTEKKINRERVEEKREVAATNEITCGKIKPKKNRASKLSIIFGIVTWILLFSVVGAAFSLITVIIGVVFGIKGLFSKEKGKSVIGLIINALYFAVIIMML